MTDAQRLDLLEQAFRNIPDLALCYAEDGDTEDNLGMIPTGWNIRHDSVCAEPLMVNAPTFRELIDGLKDAITYDAQEERP